MAWVIPDGPRCASEKDTGPALDFLLAFIYLSRWVYLNALVFLFRGRGFLFLLIVFLFPGKEYWV